MGQGALSVASPGQDIPSSHHNELVSAFLQNIVPRNASRTAEDLAGQLGTSALRWLRAYCETYHIGTAANNLVIYEGAPNEIWIERDGAANETIKIRNSLIEMYVDGSLKFKLDANGIEGAYLKTDSVGRDKIASFSNPIKVFSPVVGSTAVEIVQLTYQVNLISGQWYEFNVSWKGITINDWFDLDLEGPSQPLVALYRLNTNTPDCPGYMKRLYQAPASGTFTIKHFGRLMSADSMQCWANEL